MLVEDVEFDSTRESLDDLHGRFSYPEVLILTRRLNTRKVVRKVRGKALWTHFDDVGDRDEQFSPAQKCRSVHDGKNALRELLEICTNVSCAVENHMGQRQSIPDLAVSVARLH